VSVLLGSGVWAHSEHGLEHLGSRERRLGQRVGTIGATALQEEGDVALPCCRPDPARRRHEGAVGDQEIGEILWGEIVAEASLTLGARDQLRGQGVPSRPVRELPVCAPARGRW